MAASFKDYSKKWDARIAEISKMENSYVEIGFQEKAQTRSQVKGNRRKEGGLSMAQIAAENEFGTSRIPARPFMRTSFDENRDRINRAVEGEYNKVVLGESTVRKSLSLIGLYMQDLIVSKIRAIHTPPNSPYTIALKKSSKPLIDFGQMVQSVRYKVVVE